MSPRSSIPPPPPICNASSLTEHTYYANESLIVQGTPPQAAADCPDWCAEQQKVHCEARAAFRSFVARKRIRLGVEPAGLSLHRLLVITPTVGRIALAAPLLNPTLINMGVVQQRVAGVKHRCRKRQR